MNLSRRRLLVAAGAAALLLLVARAAAAVYADWAWYDALGAGVLWRAKVADTLLLQGTTWLLGTAFVFVNLYAVRTSVLSLVVPRRVANLEIDAEVPGRFLMSAAVFASLAMGALLTVAQDDWRTLTLARTVRRFDEPASYLQHDLALWVSWLPLERAWYTWAQVALVSVSCLVVLLYALTSGLRWAGGTLHVASYVRRHLSVLGALLLILLAWGYRLERLLLLVNGGTDGYVGFTEHRVMLTTLLALSVLTAACAVLVLWAGYTGQVRLAFGAVTFVIVMAITLQQVVPAVGRWMARDVPEARRVWPYRSTQQLFTRRAYGLQAIQIGDDRLRFSSAAALPPALAVWDPAALVAAAERAGRGREVVGAIGWSATAAGITALAAARELATDSLAPGSGWSLVTMPAGDADRRLEPLLPPPGMRATPLSRVIVAPGLAGHATQPDSATPIAAPRLRTGWHRLLLALSTQNLRVFFDRALQPDDRFITRRDVRERIAALAPPFHQDAAVTPVSAGGTLYWAVHLYTSVRSYPLALPIRVGSQDAQYFQHAGVALVDAHTGRVRLVAPAAPEALARRWQQRFQVLYTPATAIPDELARQLPPPGEGLVVQAWSFARVGSAAGQGAQPLEPAGSGADSLFARPTPVPFANPDGSGTTVAALPLLNARTQRVHGVMLATGGLRPRTVYLPVDTAVTWTEALRELRRAASSEAAAAAGSRIVAGQVRTVVVNDALTLIQPFVAWRFDGAPALARLGVFAGDSLRQGGSLAAALGVPVMADTATLPVLPGSDPATLYRVMREALQRADWAAFGAAFDALGRALRVQEPR